jgi:putative oxidoreductase
MKDTSFTARWSSLTPYLLAILRIVAAFLFVQYGTTKLFAYPAALMPGGGTVSLTSLAGVAGALELVGGALLLMGLFTRPVAFLLSGEMAAHLPSSSLSSGSMYPRLDRACGASMRIDAARQVRYSNRQPRTRPT